MQKPHWKVKGQGHKVKKWLNQIEARGIHTGELIAVVFHIYVSASPWHMKQHNGCLNQALFKVKVTTNMIPYNDQ